MENNSKLELRINGIELKAEGDALQMGEWLKTVIRESGTVKGEPDVEVVERRLVATIPGPEEDDEDDIFCCDCEKEAPVLHDVVAIYDDAGIPSIMHRFRRATNRELFGGSEKIHPAFVIGGEVYDEIFISVYENCEINGKPYSLPMQKPWTSITNEEAARKCFSKGEGWHLMTRAEWGLLANICSKNGIFPHGNTNYGKYHADEKEKGVSYDGGCRTLTGSGPASWTHNHKPTGVHDLCGNVWETVRGFRIRNGLLQAAKDNDAAMDIDLTLEGDAWENIKDDSGKPVRVSIEDGEIIFTTKEEISEGYDGCRWGNVKIDCESEQLKELGLYPGEADAYCYIDSTNGEYLPRCGGSWSLTSVAGVFLVDLDYPRSNAYSRIGFRSAYYRKRSTED